MSIFTYKKNVKVAVSDNFNSNEFYCKGKGCCSSAKIDGKLVNYLQQIRTHFNAPVTINSAYRCATHNKAVGGASSSYHTMGMAADIVVKGVEPKEVAKYAESIGILGIGLYDGFVHIDTRSKKSFWYSHAQTPRDTFGGVNVIKDWQLAAKADGFKLSVDGIWGNECEAIAKKAICKKLVVGYKNKNLTKLIQKAIGVTADGKFGAETRDAVIKWQTLMGLVPDGVFGYNSWKRHLGV